MRTVEIAVAGHRIVFESDCEEAAAYVSSLEHLVGIRPIETVDRRGDENLPRVSYLDSEQYNASFDADSDHLIVEYPWRNDVPRLFDPDEPFHNIVVYAIRMMLERLRQRSGEFTLHASSVVRESRGIVLTGPSEAGKTTLAMHLSQRHGFAIYANDQTVLTATSGGMDLVHGQGEINMRHSSMQRYAPDVSNEYFASNPDDLDPWDHKVEVPLHEIGLESVGGTIPVAMVVRLRLDSDTQPLRGYKFSAGGGAGALRQASMREEFVSKTDLFGHLSQIIRGAGFTPLDEATLGLVDMWMPSLDDAVLSSERTRFVNELYSGRGAQFVSLRGTLNDCADAVLEMFDR